MLFLRAINTVYMKVIGKVQRGPVRPNYIFPFISFHVAAS